jgi:hypothetical protein
VPSVGEAEGGGYGEWAFGDALNLAANTPLRRFAPPPPQLFAGGEEGIHFEMFGKITAESKKVASHHGPWELTIPGPYLRRWAPFESDHSLAQGQLPR